MVAQIEGFLTRSDLGLVRPESVSYNVTPQHGGLAVHWNGPRAANATHADCIRTWKNVQKFHMETNGWVDIAYSIGFCNHGYVFAGRGYGVRTAANGTNFGNQNYLAAYWIGGEGQTPTQKAYNALDWIIVDFRKKGAGRRVRPHQDFTGSACPGPHFIKYCRSRDNQNVPTSGGSTPQEDVVTDEQMDRLLSAISAAGAGRAGRDLQSANVWGHRDERSDNQNEQTKSRHTLAHARWLRATGVPRILDGLDELAHALEGVSNGDTTKVGECSANIKEIAAEVRREFAESLKDDDQ